MNSLRLIVTLLMLVFATTPTLAAVCASTVSKDCEQMSGNMAGAGESMSCPCDQQTPADGHDDTAAMAELCALAGAAALGHSLKTMPHATHAVHFPETAVIAVSLNPPPPHKPPKA